MLLSNNNAVELEISEPKAIIPSTTTSTIPKPKRLKPRMPRKVQDIINKKNVQKAARNYNPLLPEADDYDIKDVDLNNDDDKENKTEERVHSFELITHCSQQIEKKQPKYYNIYCMLLVSNILLFGIVLLFMHNYIADAVAVLLILVGCGLNAFTIWTFCGQKLCPRFFQHTNKLKLF